MAPPRKKVDVEQIKMLAGINCSYAEIAAMTGVNESTLTRRYAQVIRDGRANGHCSLKRMMFKKCQDGSVPMMIWLSKNMLGYTDKIQQTSDVNLGMSEEVEELLTWYQDLQKIK